MQLSLICTELEDGKENRFVTNYSDECETQSFSGEYVLPCFPFFFAILRLNIIDILLLITNNKCIFLLFIW